MPFANTRVTLLLSIPFRFLGINVTSLKKPCHLVFEKSLEYEIETVIINANLRSTSTTLL